MSPPVKVLIADDDPVSLQLMQRTLEGWGYAVITAEDGDIAWRILQAPEAPSLVIVDWEMPWLDGPELCRLLKAHIDKHHIYVIMVTSKAASEDIVTAMEAGADDYIEKPFRQEELRVRLRKGERMVEMQSSLRLKASHDDLTGILNRRMVVEMLGREHHRAIRDQRPLAVALLDLDFFKQINDNFGHQVGDTVLREAAKRITTSIRVCDLAGRYGGEEFLIVMPRCDDSTSLRVADRVRTAIEATPMGPADRPIAVTASIGVAATIAPAYTTPGDLIANADAALYRAKAGGRNRVDSGPADPSKDGGR